MPKTSISVLHFFLCFKFLLSLIDIYIFVEYIYSYTHTHTHICWNRISICSSRWPGAHCVSLDGLDFVAILLPHHPEAKIMGMSLHIQLSPSNLQKHSVFSVYMISSNSLTSTDSPHGSCIHLISLITQDQCNCETLEPYIYSCYLFYLIFKFIFKFILRTWWIKLHFKDYHKAF